MEKTRVEAFSDGVLAIAITLLILEIRVPEPESLGPGGLGHYLGAQWSSYAAYLLSFVVIGIMWVNHHAIFHAVARVDRVLLLLNLHLLLWIAFLPFPTALVARYFRHGDDAGVAMAVYSAVMLVIGIAFQLLWQWICRNDRLLQPHIDRQQARARAGRFGLGLLVYLGAIGLSFVSALATLVVHFLIAGYYVVDQLSVEGPTEDAA
jgi:uncharacterized membrane protein